MSEASSTQKKPAPKPDPTKRWIQAVQDDILHAFRVALSKEPVMLELEDCEIMTEIGLNSQFCIQLGDSEGFRWVMV